MASFIKVQLRVTPRWEAPGAPRPASCTPQPASRRRPPSRPADGWGAGRWGGGVGFLRLGSPIVDQVKVAYQLTRKAGREGKAGRGGGRTVTVAARAAAAASLSRRRRLGGARAAPLSGPVVVVGGRAGRRVHVGGRRRRRGRRVHVVVVVMVVVVAVPADAGEGVGGGPALRPQVVVVGGGRRRRVLVGVVVEGLRGGGLQAQFVVGRAGPAAARAAQRHQAAAAAAARQRGAEDAGHELLVRGLGVQRRPAGRLPLVLPPALGSICGGTQRQHRRPRRAGLQVINLNQLKKKKEKRRAKIKARLASEVCSSMQQEPGLVGQDLLTAINGAELTDKLVHA